MAQQYPIEVLLVEDDPADVTLIEEALGQSDLAIGLHVVGDGEQARHFLRKTHEFTGTPRPSLVVLDLNLPRRSGLEVLAAMKTCRDLLTIRWPF
jgi:DNA-binding response OmpR family regulator